MPAGAAPGGVVALATVARKPAGKGSAGDAALAGVRDFTTHTAAASVNASSASHGRWLGFGAAGEGQAGDFFGIGAV